jgi:hypothetical protein
MTAKADEFEVQIVRNCPVDATYYYLFRFDRKNEQIRFPAKHALRARPPFEHPIDCKPGVWLVAYSSDAAGLNKVQHIGNRPHVEAELRVPAAVQESADEPRQVTEDLVKLLAHQPGKIQDIDADDEGLKAARIDAKKREIALDITAKEQDVMLSGAITKETMEAYMLNRFHRTELHAQVEAMFRVQKMSADMMERNFVLTEKVQEAIGRAAEMERIAAQKVASPPPPPDYTPVLNNLVAAFRDIGVSAMQRDDRKAIPAGEPAATIKAALGDSTTGAHAVAADNPSSSAAAVPAAAAPESSTQTATRTQKPQGAESEKLADVLARLQADNERMKAELELLRQKKREAEEPRPQLKASSLAPSQPATPPPPSAASAASRRTVPPAPTHDAASTFPRLASRNADCPCGSGRKYKKCCLQQQARKANATTAASSTTTESASAGSHSSAVPGAAAAQTGSSQASLSSIEFMGEPLVLPDGVLSPALTELLAQLQSGALADEPSTPIPPPRVARVKQVEAVLVNPPTMDRETARRYLADGTMVEALGGLLFFNPMLRTILLQRRGG